MKIFVLFFLKIFSHTHDVNEMFISDIMQIGCFLHVDLSMYIHMNNNNYETRVFLMRCGE